MRVFLLVLFASFFGVLGALYADRWLMASDWVPVPSSTRLVVRRFSPDDVEITVRGAVSSPRPALQSGQSPDRRQYPQGEIYWSDPSRK